VIAHAAQMDPAAVHLRAREHEVTMKEPLGSFHHQDEIRTPLSEWLFMGGALLAVLIGLPVLLAVLFEFVVPLLGRVWNR
jgi:hypothetical protein